MPKFSKKLMGKEVGEAAVYAPPHNMKGNAGVDLKNSGYQGGNRLTNEDLSLSVGAVRGKPYPEVKTSGIKVRGTGAATKGLMARGPMA
jgi:hypothetical protein